jgi:hypothetical protein
MHICIEHRSQLKNRYRYVIFFEIYNINMQKVYQCQFTKICNVMYITIVFRFDGLLSPRVPNDFCYDTVLSVTTDACFL